MFIEGFLGKAMLQQVLESKMAFDDWTSQKSKYARAGQIPVSHPGEQGEGYLQSHHSYYTTPAYAEKASIVQVPALSMFIQDD